MTELLKKTPQIVCVHFAPFLGICNLAWARHWGPKFNDSEFNDPRIQKFFRKSIDPLKSTLKSVTDKYRAKSILFVRYWENKKGLLTSETRQGCLLSDLKASLKLDGVKLRKLYTVFLCFGKKYFDQVLLEWWLNMWCWSFWWSMETHASGDGHNVQDEKLGKIT